MSDALDTLGRYFTTGTAEAEGNILDSVFVPMADFVDILTPPYASPRLLVGKKGSGKSAFVREVSRRLKEAKVPLLVLKPKDIKSNWPTEPASLGELTRYAEHALVQAISAALGSQLRGFLTEAQNELLRAAQDEGLADKDFVQKTLAILKPIGQALTNVDFVKFADNLPTTAVKLEKLVRDRLSSTGQLLYLVIDDTDQLASPSEPNQLNRIWSILLAVRSILEVCPDVRAVVTLRTEVWKRMSRYDKGQRDQVDHFRNLVHELNPSDQDIARILGRRIRLAAEEFGCTPQQDCYSYFFEGSRVQIPTTEDEFRGWSDFIVKRARERPRDSIQFVALLIKAAKKAGHKVITNEDVKNSITQYSSERVSDLGQEVGEECLQIESVVRSFSRLIGEESFKIKAETLYKHLGGLPSSFGCQLMGKTLHPSSEADIFQLWRYLNEIGFLNARVPDATKEKGFKHITIQDDPNLVSKPRWNEIQTMMWEVHPAYRDYLFAIRENQILASEGRKSGSVQNLKTRRGGSPRSRSY